MDRLPVSNRQLNIAPLCPFPNRAAPQPRATHHHRCRIHGYMGLVQPLGQVTLQVGLGTAPKRQVMMANFLIADLPSLYNMVFRRPIFNLFQATFTTFHMTMKFPIRDDSREVNGDQYQARI
ncbi:hypothetical protein ACS0TY_012786 [Phlomoides rotata]